ncbi:MAG: DNA translocase FtsK [Dysosmobacter sp.]|nr:DNA translocase FtsK [Dysosmobacter sp.]
MATTASQTKKTTTKKTSSRGTSSANPGGSRTPKTPPQPEKRPIRREVTGGVFLLLGLCTVGSYFQQEGYLLEWLRLLFGGLFGYGYWLAGPVLFLAALILLFHHGRPVQLRVTCLLLVPLFFGALCHTVMAPSQYTSSVKILAVLWKSGIAMESGGAVSGSLAVGSIAVVGKTISIIVFTAVFVMLVMVSYRNTIGALVEKFRSRPRYEPEPEPEPRKQPAIRMVQEEEPARKENRKPIIDIPLDDEPAAADKKSGLFTGFFRHKADNMKTPDQLLTENAGPELLSKPEPPREEVPIVVEAATVRPMPAPEKTPEPAPAPAPVPAPAPAPAPAESRKKAAAEVAEATAAVTEEIARKMTAEGEDDYQYPPITLLNENHAGNFAEVGAELRNNSRRLAETLSSFGVDAKAGEVIHGPTVTRYEFVLDQGVKLSKITGLADDIALALGASGVRIAPIPDKISVVGIEVPNKQVTNVLIRDVIESREFTASKSNVAFAVGKDIGGNCIIGNIAKLPHVLIAGTTGSGKSVCTNSLIISLLYKSSPKDVRFIMVDPKMVELAPYNGIPHLLIPVVTDPKKAAGALQWAVFEMMKRYKLFSEHNVKDLAGYNALAKTSDELEHMASVVVVIDELADLMLVAAKEVEESICRVAQMGRAAGVHLVIATQRPSTDVITGLMKANIPSRIAFAVASSLESRIILDTNGAEKLVGKGDMLYAPLGMGKPQRVQGCFISPEEIERVVDFIKQTGEAQYDDEVIQKIEESVQEKEKGGKGGAAAAAAADTEEDGDELLPAAVEVVLETGQASVSMLQRRLKLGYSRAARLVDQMEERGIVGPFEGSKPRQLLITKERWQEMQMGGAPSPEETE